MSELIPDLDEASEEVIHIAEHIIKAHHPYLQALNICFVFRKDAQKSKGRAVIGNVSRVPDKYQPFMEYSFMIWLSREDFEAMTSEQRCALIDHELCHIQLRSGSYTLVGHDFEEFYEIIQRYGLWDERLRRVDRELTGHQMSLGLEVSNVLDAMIGKVGTVSREQILKMEQS